MIEPQRQPETSMFNMISFLKRGLSISDAIDGTARGTVTLIDLRELSELRSTGKAKGALHIPLQQLQEQADPAKSGVRAGLHPSACIALYCASGMRSSAGKRVLRRLGYDNVHNIGSLSRWVRAGGEVDPA
jgi:rhodanese-related sulfurtransferase